MLIKEVAAFSFLFIFSLESLSGDYSGVALSDYTTGHSKYDAVMAGVFSSTLQENV